MLATDGEFFMCVVDDAVDGARARARLRASSRALSKVRGVYVTAPGDEGYDIVSRCFAPRVGIDEDPVTGSMHCVLVAYWAPRLGKDELNAYQASARGGEMTITQKGDRALFTGRATTVLAGELQRVTGARRAARAMPSRSETSRLPAEQLARTRRSRRRCGTRRRPGCGCWSIVTGAPGDLADERRSAR